MKTTRTLSVKDIDRIWSTLINLAHPDPHDPQNESHRMARALKDRRTDDELGINRHIGWLVRVVDGKLKHIATVNSITSLRASIFWTSTP